MSSNSKIKEIVFETRTQAMHYLREKFPNANPTSRAILEYSLDNEVFWRERSLDAFESSGDSFTDLIMVCEYEGAQTLIRVYRTYISMMVLAASIGDLSTFQSVFKKQDNHIALSLKRAIENQHREIAFFLIDNYYDTVKSMYGGLTKLSIDSDADRILKELILRNTPLGRGYLAPCINRNSIKVAKLLCGELKTHVDKAFPKPDSDWFYYLLKDRTNDVQRYFLTDGIPEQIKTIWI